MRERILNLMISEGLEPLSDATTWTQLGLDSLDYLDLIVAIESRLELHVDDKAMATFTCVGDLIEWLEAHPC